MKTFNDAKDQPWLLDITVSALRRIKAVADVDLGDFTQIASGEILKRLAADPVLLADVLYAALLPEVERRGMAKDDFCDLICGDAIEDATRALLESLADFFPKAQGAVLRTILDIASRETRKAMEETAADLAALSGGQSTDARES
jgi:hypothetical protein